MLPGSLSINQTSSYAHSEFYKNLTLPDCLSDLWKCVFCPKRIDYRHHYGCSKALSTRRNTQNHTRKSVYRFRCEGQIRVFECTAGHLPARSNLYGLSEFQTGN